MNTNNKKIALFPLVMLRLGRLLVLVGFLGLGKLPRLLDPLPLFPGLLGG